MPCIHLVLLSAPRILIVEDEAALADVVSELLIDEGYVVMRARDGITALNMLSGGQRSFDLIVCDVMLPGLRGDRLAGEVRRRFPNQHLPILLVSASGDPHLSLGDVWFMAKPVDFKNLLRTVERLLEPRRRGAAATA
jgi:CheY-like chemotaxis protein